MISPGWLGYGLIIPQSPFSAKGPDRNFLFVWKPGGAREQQDSGEARRPIFLCFCLFPFGFRWSDGVRGFSIKRPGVQGARGGQNSLNSLSWPPWLLGGPRTLREQAFFAGTQKKKLEKDMKARLSNQKLALQGQGANHLPTSS